MSATAVREPVVPAGRLIDAWTHDAVAETEQVVAVAAPADVTWRALWDGDLLSGRLARTLVAVAMVPERVNARLRHQPPPPRTAEGTRLRDLAGGGTAWVPLGVRAGHEVLLGLLWHPPVGGTVVGPEEYDGFTAPGFVKVLWGFEVLPDGPRRSRLVCRTRSMPLDVAAARRFRWTWALVRPFAAVARRAMAEAVRRAAER